MAQTQKLMEKGKASIQPARTISKVGIIGAGQMGSGIAHVVALSGYTVALNDLKKEAYDKGVEAVGKNLARQIAKGAINEDDRDKALDRISFAPTLEAFGDCDLVIEAATEDESLKHRIFAALCPHLKPTALLASNTSSISITRLAATTDRPEDFIGMHFMNPVPLM
ncbi:MAG TPA: 3-hydroxyacyl-CoA dehydrogenase NAD-binding domain-containing protein, partial [Hyphomicrobium sp.]|nr:3-hydroxyacyl-CoA dehydrogenase NAD-binding domain-containing protein [Hyphomicrobium sp.]